MRFAVCLSFLALLCCDRSLATVARDAAGPGAADGPRGAVPEADDAAGAGGAGGAGGAMCGTDPAPVTTSSTCGGVAVLGPQALESEGPGVSDACKQCVDASCCSEAIACAAEPECVSFRDCTGRNVSPTLQACRAACSQRHAAGATASSALSLCRNDGCSAVCADLACLGRVRWPAPTTPTYLIALSASPARLGWTPTAPVTIHVCAEADAICALPLQTLTLVPGANPALLTLPATVDGTSAYAEVSSAEIMTSLLYFRFTYPPATFGIPASVPVAVVLLVRPSDLETTTAAVGVTPDAARGHVRFQTHDCFSNPLGGANVAADTGDARAASIYFTAGLETPGWTGPAIGTATGPLGTGLLVNLPAGATTLTTTVTSGRVGATSVVVRAGALTQVDLVPTP